MSNLVKVKQDRLTIELLYYVGSIFSHSSSCLNNLTLHSTNVYRITHSCKTSKEFILHSLLGKKKKKTLFGLVLHFYVEIVWCEINVSIGPLKARHKRCNECELIFYYLIIFDPLLLLFIFVPCTIFLWVLWHASFALYMIWI